MDGLRQSPSWSPTTVHPARHRASGMGRCGARPRGPECRPPVGRAAGEAQGRRSTSGQRFAAPKWTPAAAQQRGARPMAPRRVLGDGDRAPRGAGVAVQLATPPASPGQHGLTSYRYLPAHPCGSASPGRAVPLRRCRRPVPHGAGRSRRPNPGETARPPPVETRLSAASSAKRMHPPRRHRWQGRRA
jgi:hypothetical protein